MPVHGKLGRRPNNPAQPRLRLTTHLAATPLPPAPTTVDYHSHITDWPMYGNDVYGDCVWAEIGHEIESHTGYGQGAAVEVSVAAVLKGYSDVTGFDPNDPSTDQGTVIQDAMGYWRKTGVGGHRIDAFAEVDVANATELRQALYLFGGLSVGLNFPASAMDQFDAGKPWDVVADDGGIEGGHCVELVGYDGRYWYVVTWGQVQKVTAAFWAAYMEEAWLPILASEWVSAVTGKDPVGAVLVSLGEEFATLTGEANPFPGPAPTPVPVPPVPGPAPTPDPVPTPVDDADRELADGVRHWAHQHHHGRTEWRVAEALRDWMAAKGL